MIPTIYIHLKKKCGLAIEGQYAPASFTNTTAISAGALEAWLSRVLC